MTGHSNSGPRQKHPWNAALLCFICVFIWHVAFVGMTLFFTADQIYPYMWDFNSVENAQLGLIISLIICLTLYTGRADTNMGWIMVVLAGLLFFREMDADKLYAGESIWKLAFYTRFDAPVMVKILAGLFTLSAIGILITFFIRQVLPFITGLWQGNAVAWITGSALGGIVLSTLVDMLNDWIVNGLVGGFSTEAYRWCLVYEESMELTAYALLLTAATIAYRRSSEANND